MFNIAKEELAAGVKKADNETGVFHFKNAVSLNPSWDEFFEHLDFEAHNKASKSAPPGDPFSERSVNMLILKNLFYMAAYVTKEDIFKNLKEFREFTSSALETDVAPVTSFVSLIRGDTSDPHHDCRKTLFWQCHGETTFHHLASSDKDQQSNPGNILGEYIVSPGDLIYLGWEVPHNVYVTGPRAAITFDVYESNMVANPYPGQEYARGEQ